MRTLLIALVVPLALGVASCSFLVDFDPEGKPCSDAGTCLPDYHCIKSNVCVAGAAVDSGPKAAGADAGDLDAGDDAGEPGPDE